MSDRDYDAMMNTNAEVTAGIPEKLGAPAKRAPANARITSLAILARQAEAEIMALHGIGPAFVAHRVRIKILVMKITEKHLARVHAMSFASVYPMYIQKAEKKGRTKAEVDQIIFWLTGYDAKTLKQQIDKNNNFEAFFAQAPRININASKITGVICGYRVEEIEDKVLQQVRYLDKLVDELAKGRAMEKILRA